jgi:DNA-binding HxlR family transcriptional regulator
MKERATGPTPPPDASIGAPVEAFIRIFRGRHKPDILICLGKGRYRFAELRRAIPGLSERVLARQLDELEHDGLIERTVYAEVPHASNITSRPAARPCARCSSRLVCYRRPRPLLHRRCSRSNLRDMQFDTKIAVVVREDLPT